MVLRKKGLFITFCEPERNEKTKSFYLNPFYYSFKQREAYFLQSNVRQRHEKIVLKDFVLKPSRKAHKKQAKYSSSHMCFCLKDF